MVDGYVESMKAIMKQLVLWINLLQLDLTRQTCRHTVGSRSVCVCVGRGGGGGEETRKQQRLSLHVIGSDLQDACTPQSIRYMLCYVCLTYMMYWGSLSVSCICYSLTTGI